MSVLTQLLAQIGGEALNKTGLHVVITAPDGEKLFVPVTMPTAGEGDSRSLWPSGYKIGLALGDVPNLPNVTTAAGSFLARKSLPVLLGYLSTPTNQIK